MRLTIRKTPRLLALLLLLAAPAAAQGGIIVSMPANAAPNTVVCVHVLTTVPFDQLSFNAELNGVAARISVSQDAEGTVEVCVDVPLAAAGGTLTITVTGGGCIGSGSVGVSAPVTGG